jgi:hypothetical protein
MPQSNQVTVFLADPANLTEIKRDFISLIDSPSARAVNHKS